MIKFRRTVPEDLLQIERWIALDFAHRGMDANFWIATAPGVACYAVEDEEGPIIYVRQEAKGDSTIMHLQFANCGRKKIFAALKEGYPLVAESCRGAGFKFMRFESQSPALIRVMLDMGFHADLVAAL